MIHLVEVQFNIVRYPCVHGKILVIHWRWGSTCFGLLYFSDRFQKGGWDARKTYNKGRCVRLDIFIKTPRFNNRIFYCVLHNLSSVMEKTTSYNSRTKSASDATALGEKEEEGRSRKKECRSGDESVWMKILSYCTLIVLGFTSCYIQLGVFMFFNVCLTPKRLYITSPLCDSSGVYPIPLDLHLSNEL